jgi:uncharacterized protein involved in exopolysaccharide biosynthesis
MNNSLNSNDPLVFISENKKIIKRITLSIFIVSILYSFFADVYYKSEITLYPAGELSDSGEIFSDFSDIIENLGISELSSDNNFYIPDIIESKSLKKKIVNKTWDNERFDSSVNLIDYWEINKTSWFSSFVQSINTYFNNFSLNTQLAFELESIEKLDELIYVDEKNSGLIQIIVLMDEPKLASDIANFIASYVVDYVSKEQRHFATKNKEYLSNRLILSKNDLYDSENELTAFRKQYPVSHDTPELQLSRLRLIRSVDVNQEVYITIKKQLELSKVEESKERLFINILDRASPSVYKEYPKRLIIVTSFTILGAFISVLYLLIIFRMNQFYFKKN